MSEIYDYAKVGNLTLIIRRDENAYYFNTFYNGSIAESSWEGLKWILSLYGEKIRSARGRIFEFQGEFKKEFENYEVMGYSTNTVVAFDGKILKSYRKIGSREPDIMLSLQGMVPGVLGWGKYDEKYIQIITERIVGDDVGKIFYRNYRSFLDGNGFGDILPTIGIVAQTINDMHRRLEKFGLERISKEDVRRWRMYVNALIKSANINIHIEDIFENMAGKEKILTHQDLHLSQMIMKDGKIYIIDFEGEPLRGNQFEKLQPVRDVATVARAFHYINEGAMDEWEREMIERIYREYRKLSKYDFDLLDYVEWMIEKAVYEVNYELKFRKNMVKIPRRGLERLIEMRRDLL